MVYFEVSLGCAAVLAHFRIKSFDNLRAGERVRIGLWFNVYASVSVPWQLPVP